MATSDFSYVFPYSSEEAKRLKRLPMWRESHKANIACKKAIEQAVRRDYDGSWLKPGCAGSVIAEYGYIPAPFESEPAVRPTSTKKYSLTSWTESAISARLKLRRKESRSQA